jgi:hypothetical protein
LHKTLRSLRPRRADREESSHPIGVGAYRRVGPITTSPWHGNYGEYVTFDRAPANGSGGLRSTTRGVGGVSTCATGNKGSLMYSGRVTFHLALYPSGNCEAPSSAVYSCDIRSTRVSAAHARGNREPHTPARQGRVAAQPHAWGLRRLAAEARFRPPTAPCPHIPRSPWRTHNLGMWIAFHPRGSRG